METRSPTVDVVILSWNRREDTMAAIDSVLTQDIDSVALWIVDQGSAPEQRFELRRLADENAPVRLIELPHNVGVPAGRNIGIRAGNAEYVVCLDNDAVFASSRTLAQAVERLSSDDRLGAVAFKAVDYHTGELDLGAWAYPSVLMEATHPIPVSRFVGVGHAMRRSAFTEVGGYDEMLFFCEEELDLSYRMIDRGYRIIYDPSISVLHKRSGEGRMDWDGGRTYHQVRNAVLIHHRHHGNAVDTAKVASAWMLRALYNRHGAQGWRGLRDAIRLIKVDGLTASPLGDEAREYVRTHDTRLRGSWPSRIRRELLSPFPAEARRQVRLS